MIDTDSDEFPGVSITTRAGEYYTEERQKSILAHIDAVEDLTEEELDGSGIYIFDDERVSELQQLCLDHRDDYVMVNGYNFHHDRASDEFDPVFEEYVRVASWGTADEIVRSDGSRVALDDTETTTLAEYVE